ncbi:phosphate ABC transporter permease PstA [Candidatus Pseudoscillospira sp. SGI.172]|uniref:phosphate ABC transporter permease PstA n=1 Tax=Candidatus Pseudoscillospira sp. SGI.172 TaxID=3420582 RepID=UPI0009B9887B|nr:phosphate ABC transporter permease PstA [Pseudoflavonifractor sp.]MDY3020023.1 phosphate ABC transporter permease PstA [Oscillospiraceae bacterium]
MEMKHLSPRRVLYDRVLRFLLYFSALLTCTMLVVLIGYIFYRGLPEVSWEMLTTEPSVLRDVIGILPNLINTLALIVGTLLIVLPLGVGAAIYLTEYARSRRVVELIEFATETLTGIPSILYGLVGMLFFVQFLGWGGSIRAGIFTLVIMILPTIVRTTQESLKTVPQAYREAALGLGSGKWHMIRTVVLPSSVDGIVTGCILSIGRIVGESAALLYTAGSASVLVGSLRKLLTTSGGSLTVALYMYTMERGKIATGFAIASILMILTLVINLSAKWLGGKLKRK